MLLLPKIPMAFLLAVAFSSSSSFFGIIRLSLVPVVHAEKINFKLDDLEGLTELFSGLAGAAKQKKDGTCPSACEGHPREPTWYPAPKPRIRPYSNGCSVPTSMRDSIGDYSLFDSCCDLHDSCYMACGVPKPYCESQFQKCLTRTCDTKYQHNTQKKKRDDCHGMASIFTTGTSMFGCNGYNELQKFGCDCVNPKEAEVRMKQYARDVYATYNTTHPELPPQVVQRFLQHPADRPKSKRQDAHGILLYKLFERYPNIIDKISSDGKASKDRPSYFSKPKDYNPKLGGQKDL